MLKLLPRFIIMMFIVLAFSGRAQPSLYAQEETPPAEATDEAQLPRPQRPDPFTVVENDGVTLELLFGTLPQGRAGVLHVIGDGVIDARLQFRDQLVDFFPIQADGLYALLAVDMEQAPRVYDLSVLAWKEDGSRTTLNAQFEVTTGGFIQQDFDVPPDRVYLTNPDVERLEFARLDAIFLPLTTERGWAGDGFQVPIDSTLTSPFGSYRVFNQTLPTRHTGWDLQAPVGTPILAMAGGRVAFAGLMDIRGNHVVIDHGYGIYSGYSHMSQVHVAQGQTVTRGQILGMTGNTGRSSGPHLHWEITVNGVWVDSVDFLQMWLPW